MNLKSVDRRYLDKRIAVFALNSQSHWFMFAIFGNFCLSKFDQVRKIFEKVCITKISQNFLNPVIYFD